MNPEYPEMDLEEDGSDVEERAFIDDFSCQVDKPDLRLKFKKSVQNFRIGAHLTFGNPKQNALRERGLVLTLRPKVIGNSLKDKLLNKVSIDAKEGEVVWSAGKLQLWNVFKVKLVAGYNYKTRSPLWQYRVTTKWNQDDHRALYKLPAYVGERVQVIPNFDLEYSFPSMGGGSAGTEADSGSCHLKLPRVDVVFCLDKEPLKILRAEDVSINASKAPLKQGVLRTQSAEEIEEIPLLRQEEEGLGLSKSSKTKWTRGDRLLPSKESSQKLERPAHLDIPLIPAPWGQNPFRFPWISRDQWHDRSRSSAKSSPTIPQSKHRDSRQSAWGLDAN